MPDLPAPADAPSGQAHPLTGPQPPALCPEQSRLALLQSLAQGEELGVWLHRLAQSHQALFPQARCEVRKASANEPVEAAQATNTPAASGPGARRQPLLGTEGDTLGWLQREGPQAPPAEEATHLNFLAQLATLALQAEQRREKLENSERRSRDILAAIPDLVWIKSPDDRFIDCNPAFERRVGLPRQAILGQTHLPQVQQFSPGTAELLAAGKPQVMEVWDSADTHQTPQLFELIRTPLWDAQQRPTGVLGLARDITLHKQAEAGQTEQRQLLETMFRQSTECIALLDPDTQDILHFNDAACEQLGYTREQFAQLHARDFQAELTPQQIAAFNQSVVQGQVIEQETRHRRADGSTQLALLRLQAVAYAGRTLISAVWRDISEAKRNEARILRLNQAYALLSRVNEAVVRIREPNALLAEICRITVDTGGFRLAWIGGLQELPQTPSGEALPTDPAEIARRPLRRYIVPQVHAGYSSGYVETLRIPYHPDYDGPVNRALSHGRIGVVSDIAQSGLNEPWRSALLERGLHGMAALPIRVNGAMQQCLVVYSALREHFDEEQLTLLDRLAGDIGFALEFFAAELARNAEQRFREELVESVDGLFFALNPLGQLVMWNRRMEEVSGYRREDIRAAEAARLFFREPETSLVAQRIADSFAQGQSAVQAHLVTADGRRLPYYFASRRIESAEGPLIVGTAMDISARVAAEAELQRHRQHLEELVEQRTAELEAANARLAREDERLRAMLGLSQRASGLDEASLCQCGLEEVLQLSNSRAGCLWLHEAGADQPEHLACLPESLSPLLRPSQAALLHQWVRERGQAQAVEAGNTESPVPPPPGLGRMLVVPVLKGNEVPLLLCMFGKPQPYDDADMRELQHFGTELWRILRRRRIELALERAKAEAEAANQAKSVFLANMSHEIRTPMNAIIGFAHLLKRDPLSPRQQDHVRKITEASQHLSQVIDDVLDFSKIEARKIRLEHQDFCLQDSLERVLDMVRTAALAKGLNVQLQAPTEQLLLRGDRLRLEQVLLNLLGNAVKFTAQGSVRLSVQRLTGPGLQLHFEVQDTGIGIAPEQIPHLFLAFEQGDTSTTRRFGGTGLGLAISQRLCELMGGRIAVYSQLGEGSRFTLDLPFEPGAGPAETLPAAPPSDTPVGGLAGSGLNVAGAGLGSGTPTSLATQRATSPAIAPPDAPRAPAAPGHLSPRQEASAVALQNQPPQPPATDKRPALGSLDAATPSHPTPDPAPWQPVGEPQPVPSGGADPGNDQSVNTGGGIGSFDTSGNIGAGSTASTLASQQASAADVRSAASSAASTGAASGDIIGNATSTGHPSVMAVPGLDWASGLQHTGQQWPLYVRALGLFTQHHGQDSDALTEAALQGNTPRLRQLAHALAGASAAVGARLVQQQAKALEAICRTPGHGGEELHQVLPLVEALEHLIESLRAALHSPAAPAKRPPDGQPAPEQHQALHPILRRLLPLLASHDTSACEIFEAHRNEFLAGLGAEGPALAEAIDSFQFEAAHSLVTKLLDLA